MVNTPTLKRDVRNSLPETLGRSEGISRKGIETPSLSRLDMDGERKPRDYNPSGSGSTGTRTTPRNDPESGTTNRDRGNNTPRSTPPTPSTPSNRGNPRGSGLNWDNIKRTPSDIGTFGSVRPREETPQRTSIPDFQIRSTGDNRGMDNHSIRPLREANVSIPNERTSIREDSGISVRTFPSHKESFSVPNIQRNNSHDWNSRNTNSSPSISVPSFNRGGLGETRAPAITPPSRPATIDMQRIDRNPASSSFSIPKIDTPSFATPSTPSFHRNSSGFSSGRSSLGGRGIR